MSTSSKRVLRDNVLAHIARLTGALRPHETGVTRLMMLGVVNGTAQRVLDKDTDIRLDTLDLVAGALKVRPWDLIAPGAAAAVTPFRDLDPFEAQLVTLFRKLDDDERHEHLIQLNRLVDREQVASSMSPFAGVNRRQHVHGRDPERRTDTQRNTERDSSGP